MLNVLFVRKLIECERRSCDGMEGMVFIEMMSNFLEFV